MFVFVAIIVADMVISSVSQIILAQDKLQANILNAPEGLMA